MSKKTYIFGVIIIVALGGMFWYYNKKGQQTADQAASILESVSETEASEKAGSGESESEIKIKEVKTEFALGSPEAPVTMIEYSSHLCGHCVDFHSRTLPLIINKYVKTGKVRIIPRPLSPLQLGLSVLCAQEQGKFWEFNEYLFNNVMDIKSVDDLKERAGQLDLGRDAFKQCLDASKYEERVKEWFDQAEGDGIEGTPHFIINDQQIIGNQPFSEFERVIEEELNK